MRIFVGSNNPSKIEAVRECASRFERFADLEVSAKPVESKVSEQPLSLSESIEGAVNRSKSAYQPDCYAVGLEGGIIILDQPDTRMLQICACAIFDGSRIEVGLSSGFTLPSVLNDFVINQKLNLNDALQAAGLTSRSDIGQTQGAIGIVSHGRMLRSEYMQQAVFMALMQFAQV